MGQSRGEREEEEEERVPPSWLWTEEAGAVTAEVQSLFPLEFQKEVAIH